MQLKLLTFFFNKKNFRYLDITDRYIRGLYCNAVQVSFYSNMIDCSIVSQAAWVQFLDRPEFLIPCGDWNGHVGHAGTGYREVHGGMGYGRPEPDVEGERILEYALAFDLLLGNTCFKKRDSHLITYKSGNIATQIDFILFRRTMRKLVTDVKVIPGEEVALQHQLLVRDIRIDVPPKSKCKFTPGLKVWKLKDP